MNGEVNYSTRSTHVIASKTAYLIGIFEQYFWPEEMESRIFLKEIYEELNKQKSARIVRNLCMLRTSILMNFKKINELMRYENMLLENMSEEYIPQGCFSRLREDGIVLPYGRTLVDRLIAINRLIQDRINNCKGFFPDWLKWDYLRDIFVMPGGLTENGCKVSSQIYYENRIKYPYQAYINWVTWSESNILGNDYKFLSMLYRRNRDTFTEGCRVSEIADDTRQRIDDFLRNAEKTAIVVDCENVNPYHLYAALYDLEESLLQTVNKIILYNDVNTTVAWDFIGESFSIPIEQIMTKRVLEKKSLLDIALTAGTCREFFQNQTDSFILVSSDSDYWGLISAVPEARFLVMMEREQCSPHMRQILAEDNIFYCFLEDFPMDISDELRETAIYREMRKRLDAAFSMNLDTLLAEIWRDTRAGLTESAQKEMRNRFAKNLRIEIEGDGTMSIAFSDRK